MSVLIEIVACGLLIGAAFAMDRAFGVLMVGACLLWLRRRD